MQHAEAKDMKRIGEEDLADEVWQSLADVWDKKVPKVGSARWFGYKRAMELYVGMWSRRLLTMLYMALTQGLLTNALGAATFLSKVAPAEAGSDIPKQRTGAEAEEAVRTMRKLSGNTLEMCALVLGDHSTKTVNIIITKVMDPVDRSHSHRNSSCRSTFQSATWYTAQAIGESFTVCLDILRVLADPTVLEDCDFSCQERPDGVPNSVAVDADHPAVVGENHYVGLMANFALSLCTRTLLSASWHLWGYLGRFAGLLSEAHQEDILAKMAQTRRAWVEGASQWPTSFWKQLRSRSIFQNLFVEQVVRGV